MSSKIVNRRYPKMPRLKSKRPVVARQKGRIRNDAMLKRLTRIRKVSLQRADPQELRLLPSLRFSRAFSAALLAATRVNSASFRRVMSRMAPFNRTACPSEMNKLGAAGPVFTDSAAKVDSRVTAKAIRCSEAEPLSTLCIEKAPFPGAFSLWIAMTVRFRSKKRHVRRNSSRLRLACALDFQL